MGFKTGVPVANVLRRNQPNIPEIPFFFYWAWLEITSSCWKKLFRLENMANIRKCKFISTRLARQPAVSQAMLATSNRRHPIPLQNFNQLVQHRFWFASARHCDMHGTLFWASIHDLSFDSWFELLQVWIGMWCRPLSVTGDSVVVSPLYTQQF